MSEKSFPQDVRHNLQDWFFEHTLEDVKNKFDIRTGMVIPENGVKLSRRHIRHNMGFDTVDRLVEDYNVPQGGVKFNAMYGKTMIGGEKVILMKPLSFMNLSGGPVREMANYFKIDPESELIVIYDDIDLEPGQLRIRKQGSAGGHNGIKDIIRQLGTEKFLRIKVGVGAKPKGWDLADHVLGRFSTEDRKLVDEAIAKAAKAVDIIISQGTDAAMNEYNRKVPVQK